MTWRWMCPTLRYYSKARVTLITFEVPAGFNEVNDRGWFDLRNYGVIPIPIKSVP